MIGLLITLALVAVNVAGFAAARRFVRDRLRYVDSVQRPATPWIAAAGTALAALPIVWLLPFVGTGAAIVVGASVGFGVARGLADIRRVSGASWSSLPRI